MTRIELPHKVCGQTCMVNGLEDLYEWKTGVRLPDWFLFYMSGMAAFAYIKNKRSATPRLVVWGMLVKSQYEILADAVGFRWEICQGRSFAFALQRARNTLDRGNPAILGALDMYHLPYYEKFYHRYHIPYHYVLMVGYDDQQGVIFVQDCDRAGVQAIPYSDLQLAWGVRMPGMSDQNTLFTFDFDGPLADPATIARRALERKVTFMLQPPVSMLGVRGMRKLAAELPAWPQELSPEQLKACLYSLVEFTGSPPMLPARLMGVTDIANIHAGGRDGFSRILKDLAQQLQRPVWLNAAQLLDRSGQAIEELTDQVVDVIQGFNRSLAEAGTTVTQIANLEEQAYQLVKQGLQE